MNNLEIIVTPKNKRMCNNRVYLQISVTQPALAANLAFAKPLTLYYTPVSKANLPLQTCSSIGRAMDSKSVG